MRSKTIGSSTTADNTGGATADYTSLSTWASSIADTDDELGTIITKVAPIRTSKLTLNVGGTARTYRLTADSSCAVAAPTAAEAAAKARISVSGDYSISFGTTAGAIWKIDRIALISDYMFEVNNCATLRHFNACLFDTTYGADLGQCVLTVTNCAIFGSFNAASVFRHFGSGVLTIYQTSILMTGATPSTAVGVGGTSSTCYAVIVQGNTGSAGNFTSGVAGDENVSADTSAPGATNWRSKTGVFASETPGSEDLSLSAAHDAGTYTVTDRSGTEADLATDIVGTSRAAPIDAGCWQTPAAGATGNPWYYYAQQAAAVG